MMRNSGAAWLAVVAACGVMLVAAACGSDTSNPIGPSRRQVAIRAMVTDRLGHPLAGALVEVLDGARAGAKTLTDAVGKVEFRAGSAFDPQHTGMVEEFVTVRASHNGFQPRTLKGYWRFDISELPAVAMPPSEWVIWLDAGPTTGLEPGSYTLTAAIELDSARDWLQRAPCKGFPTDLATRSFQATIELRDRALDLYAVSIENRPRGSGFWLERVGRFSLFELEDGISGLFEDLPGFRYLMISGVAPTNDPALDMGMSVSVPFHATFQFCQLKSARGIANNCEQVPPEQIVDFHACVSDRATMTFTRR